MNRAILAAACAATVALALPGLVWAQMGAQAGPQAGAPLSLDAPAERHKIFGEIDQLNARIDRGLADGRLTPAQGVLAHRQVNAIQDQANTDRERGGGQLTVADRLDLQARLDHFSDDLHQQLSTGKAAPPPQ